jgi:hypothetical protein
LLRRLSRERVNRDCFWTATTELVGLVTRTTVVLEKPADYEGCVFLQKDSATRHHLWSMVNSDLYETALGTLKEPAAVEPEQYHDARVKNTDVVMRDITAKQF